MMYKHSDRAPSRLDFPLAFITSECTTEMKEMADEAGAIAFLTKPFTAETMQDAFDKVLG